MPADLLSHTFHALAHPARRAILVRLGRGQTAVHDLARPLGISAPAMTKHLKSLERGGLISRSRDAQSRPCRLEAASIRRVGDWIDQVRAMTEQRLDRLEAYLQTIQAGGDKPIAGKAKRKGKLP